MNTASQMIDEISKTVTHIRGYGLFRSLEQERDFSPLRIEGNLPKDLSGVLYQNGTGQFSNQGQVYGHIFDADGVLRGIKIQDGKAYGAAKTIVSKALAEERAAGRVLYSGYATPAKKGLWQRVKEAGQMMSGTIPGKNAANTSVLFWQDKLYATVEASPPTEMNQDSLEIIGESSLGGVVKGAFSAHSHWVSERACGYNFGIDMTSKGIAELTVYELPAKGPCKKLTSLPLHSKPLGQLHDFIATPKHLVFFAPPIDIKPSKLPGLLTGSLLPYEALEWCPELGSEIIIVPIDNPQNVTRIKTKAFFAVHFANAYETETGKIVVDYTHSDNTMIYDIFADAFKNLPYKHVEGMLEKNEGNELSVLKRATIDVAKKDIQFETLWDALTEFPKINPGFQGSKNRYTYFVFADQETKPSAFTDVCKLDLETGQADTYQLGHEQFPLEPVFVRKAKSQKEDEGYLLSMVYDAIKHSSYLAVFDAQTVASGPVAKLHFDMALPISFHGLWKPL